MKYDFEFFKADILKELDNIKILESEFSKKKDAAVACRIKTRNLRPKVLPF